MSTAAQRNQIMQDLKQAFQSGAKQAQACKLIGLSARTLQRWQAGISLVDRRTTASKRSPKHALSADEKARILATCNLPEYADLPPSQIVPKLADKGIYIASESSFYRVLHAHNQVQHRGRAAAPRMAKLPTTHTAQAIKQVWMWDITYLPSIVRGQFFYLYCVQDLYSRKVVAWEIHNVESGALAAQLLAQAKLREEFTTGLVLHSDNGAAMKSQTLRAKMHELGIASSYSRPRVSNDNPYIESLFRTLKYTPKWPSSGFKGLEQAREWVLRFVGWYNTEHQHSSLNFVTPEQRHAGLDVEILKQRHQAYLNAKQQHPARWSGKTRNWQPVGNVSLNPCRKEEQVTLLEQIA